MNSAKFGTDLDETLYDGPTQNFGDHFDSVVFRIATFAVLLFCKSIGLNSSMFYKVSNILFCSN
jgi:hypothetical protein